MEEVGAQVAPSILMHQRLSSRLCEAPTMTMTMTMAKKRHLSYQAQSQNHYGGEQQNWNPKLWDWDSVGFVGKPAVDSDSEVLRLGGAPASESPNKTTDNINYNYNYNNQKKANTTTTSAVTVGNVEDDGRLDLNLGGGLTAVDVEQPEPPVVTSKPNKRVRSGSPGTAPYPMCQVDNCKEDLSNAKDYHRRHKVCELHSKSTKALVGKQMQRFCQQCSRFLFSFFQIYITYIHIHGTGRRWLVFFLRHNESFPMPSLSVVRIHYNFTLHFFFHAGFILFQSLMRESEAVGVGLLGTTDGEGKPSQRILPHGC